MQYRILLVLTFLVMINTVIIDSYEERDTSVEKTDLKIENFKKINPIIQQWQSSADPVTFAQENNLAFSDEKIRVYIYLDKPESVSKLPQEIQVTSSADNIIVAYLDSRQITQTAQLDFVQRIDLPVLANPQERTITTKVAPNDSNPKIDSIIQQWQSSADPVTFAQENNLAFSDEKIRVYIYLDKPESVSKLPQEIQVTSSADNIVVAYLDSRQITQTAQMDFVQRVGQPILATPPPIPDEVSDDNDKYVLPQYSYYGIVIAAFIIIAGIIYFVKKKNQKTIGQKL